MTDTPEKSPDQLRIEKMDAVTDGLLALIMLPTTTEQQKGKLFERVTLWCKESGKQGPDDPAVKQRIASMDKAAEHLLDLVGAEKTSDMQKGRLFGNVMAWYKVREKLVPAEDGGKLKEMAHGLKSESGRRSGNSKRGRDTSNDGRAIRALIGKLPAFGGAAGGNPSRPERQGGGARGNGSGVRADGGSDGDRDVDGAGDGAVL